MNEIFTSEIEQTKLRNWAKIYFFTTYQFLLLHFYHFDKM